MTDEKYVYTQDVREKKITARSAKCARTHCGSGGRVRLPSDYLSNKELKAMNGEVKAYRLNEPMVWAEFKALPDDLKTSYIKLLREKFDVPDRKIADMFGVHFVTLSRFLKEMGLSAGKRAGGAHKGWDGTAWFSWINGAKPEEPPCEEETVAEIATVEDIFKPVPIPEIKILPVREEKMKAIPRSGTMTLEGQIESVLNTVAVLLGGADVRISVTWEMRHQEGACSADV